MKSMKQDFFTYLSYEIISEILSRLPLQTILSCKCVCKSWHDLVETHEFAKLHLFKSVPGLALSILHKAIDKIEVTSVLDIQHNNLHDHHFSTITKLYFTYPTKIHGSVDGLLLLRTSKNNKLHLCNPITREYIDLDSHSPPFDRPNPETRITYGFGVSKITGQYKAVRISQTYSVSGLSKFDYKVYTIGTGSWRSIAPRALVRYIESDKGAFVNGNLHWVGYDLNDTFWISCFDLETELFNNFSLPVLQIEKRYMILLLLVVVEDKLCLCDCMSGPGRTVIIWLMKEYGVEKSWTKEFVIRSPLLCSVYPIRISENGVILMACYYKCLFYYSIKNKTTQKICCEGRLYVTSLSHIPSFLSLKYFSLENSISF